MKKFVDSCGINFDKDGNPEFKLLDACIEELSKRLATNMAKAVKRQFPNDEVVVVPI
ncbi:MAG: hypothetical protein KGI50_05575 [Patescibacteria group bacterium]|nr:hypothetical protein [Patescibacteria group bacterium]